MSVMLAIFSCDVGKLSVVVGSCLSVAWVRMAGVDIFGRFQGIAEVNVTRIDVERRNIRKKNDGVLENRSLLSVWILSGEVHWRGISSCIK